MVTAAVPTTRARRLAVLRVTREFASSPYIGGFFSSLDFADTSNRVALSDARLKVAKNWVVDVPGSA